jgi:hypothetical protein
MLLLDSLMNWLKEHVIWIGHIKKVWTHTLLGPKLTTFRHVALPQYHGLDFGPLKDFNARACCGPEMKCGR